ncbi:MAG: MarR family transcriptional regulator, partial [Shimia sp.]|nr:MarR family transcriptional regulator [Shimia sp.]
HGISVNEFFLLMHLDKAEMQRLPRVELAKRTYVSASTITRTVAPMEKIGLLSRQSDARDARLAFVALTDAGATKLAEAKATFAKHAQAVFQDRWTDEEQDQLASLLHRLVVTSQANLT